MDVMLRRNWLREGEGWLSEETVDNASRLDKERLWIVDPLDGTGNLCSVCRSSAFRSVSLKLAIPSPEAFITPPPKKLSRNCGLRCVIQRPPCPPEPAQDLGWSRHSCQP
jgi:hypothetical protein